MRHRLGLAIVLVLGALAALSLVATAFAFTAFQAMHYSRNFTDVAKARYAAEAGIARAISELNAEATVNFEDTLNETWASGYNGSVGDVTYSVSITDEQRKININNANQRLLDNLPGITPAIAADIISYRASRPFIVCEELRSVSGVTADIYNNISGFITVDSYVSARFGRSPINVDTAPAAVLQAVFEGISDGSGMLSADAASALADHIIGERASAPFRNWNDFNDSVDRAVIDGHITSSEAAVVKNNCNPNKTKPLVYTTELCFNSGGAYNLLSTGKAVKGSKEMAVAERQHIVRLFKMWDQTTRDEFMQPWLNDEQEEVDIGDGDIIWITWMDSCPVNSTQNWDSTGYDTVPNALKLGYWDNFNEYVKVWTADHINDWTSWYFGYGYLSTQDGHLWAMGGWTQSNLCYQYPPVSPTISNCNRWNTGGISCTISMQSEVYLATVWWQIAPSAWQWLGYLYSDRFYWRRWQRSNSDTNIYALPQVPADAVWSGSNLYVQRSSDYALLTQPTTKYALNILSWSGYEYGSYSFSGEPKRTTLRLNADNTVASAYMSSGTIGGTQSIGYSAKSNSGPVVGQYQGWVDNVRIIPGKRGANTWNGRYISVPFALSSPAALGSITGTVTIPSSADPLSETVICDFCPDGKVDMNGDGAAEPKAKGAGLVNSVQYVVYFSTNNANLYETPVLEDVTLTYLDGVKNLYVH